ncbi:1-acyl-sn-glycerol-3-phosphate acyltransferase [Thermaurantiacus sp.]
MRLGAKLAIKRNTLTAEGLEHVPSAGPVVLAVRHYHHLLDGLGLLSQVGRPLHIMIGLDWVSSRATRRMMEGLARLCAWPVTLRNAEDRVREGVSGELRPSAYREEEIRPYQQRAFRQCVELLRLGRAVAIFPEGYPVIDPHTPRKPRADLLAPFKSGFARAAVASARRHGRPVRVVPVGIRADARGERHLAFVYGSARRVTASTDVDALIADVYDDILMLSR